MYCIVMHTTAGETFYWNAQYTWTRKPLCASLYDTEKDAERLDAERLLDNVPYEVDVIPFDLGAK